MSGKDLGTPALNMLDESIWKDLRNGYTLDEAIKHNASSILNNLLQKSQIISKAVSSGKITAVYGVYNISTGILKL